MGSSSEATAPALWILRTDVCISRSVPCIKQAVIWFSCVQIWSCVSDRVASRLYRELETHGVYTAGAKAKARVL